MLCWFFKSVWPSEQKPIIPQINETGPSWTSYRHATKSVHTDFFRVKCNGKISPKIRDELGVNQGGNASPTLFRKYLSDLGDYLSKHVGICISEEIIAHLLWADDLVLLSDSAKGLQKQLDGLLQFCAKNLMIVNETKTKVMIFGERKDDTFLLQRQDYRNQ